MTTDTYAKTADQRTYQPRDPIADPVLPIGAGNPPDRPTSITRTPQARARTLTITSTLQKKRRSIRSDPSDAIFRLDRAPFKASCDAQIHLESTPEFTCLA
ncbi:hypothetical protein ACW2Q0_30975, partial [Nocardia sp. R16R-3T]